MGAEKVNHTLEMSTLQQINGSCWQDFGDEEADDEETISLCDLVMSSDANEYWNGEDFSNKDDSNNGDFFEFFSTEDFPAVSAAAAPNKNIVFCGKLIPFKDQKQQSDTENESPQSTLKTSKSKQENGDQYHDQKKKKKNTRRSSCSFPWKTTSQSFNKSRTFPSPKGSQSQTKSFNKSLSLPADHQSNKKLSDDQKFNFSVNKKVSILATPVKSRWYLFAFGVGRFPMDIELKDMKLRQSRKISKQAMKFQAPEEVDGEANVKGGKGRRRSSSGKGLWRLLKVLGWKNKHTNGAVGQASFGCNPHV